MRRFCSLLLTIVAALSLGACSLDHSTLTTDIRTKTPQIALGVHDQRPYVVSGNKPPTFIGFTRGGYNNPFDMATKSGAPLADDMAKALAASLGRNGTSVTIVPLEHGLSRQAAMARLAQTGRKAVLVTMLEWKIDAGYVSRQLCDLELHVVGPNGTAIGQHRLADTHTFGYVAADTLFNREIPPIFKRHMEELFSAPSVAAAL
jgi:hypothetical protein